MLLLIVAASVTVLATGLGAIPVFMLGTRADRLRSMLTALAAGVMLSASVFGLILPAVSEGGYLGAVLGLAAGVGFLFLARGYLNHRLQGKSEASRTSILVFLVLLVHSLPEGFAVGTSYGTDPATIGLFVVVAISIQNIPEGTSVAIPLAAQGASPTRQFMAAILSSSPQIPGAVIAYLLVTSISSLLPFSFGFAAGAMLALVATQMVPQAWQENRSQAIGGLVAGSVAMGLLSQLLDVA